MSQFSPSRLGGRGNSPEYGLLLLFADEVWNVECCGGETLNSRLLQGRRKPDLGVHDAQSWLTNQ